VSANLRPPAGLWSERDMTGACRELEHAADVFLEVRGPDLPAVLEHGLFALYSTLADTAGVAAREEKELEARGAEPADLFRELLAEALYEYDVSGFLAAGAEVTLLDPTTARARLWGEPADHTRHGMRAEVKAVTYHRLAVWREPDGTWAAQVILDV